MKKMLLCAAALVAMPVQAATLMPGSTATFDPQALTGALIASMSSTVQALTFTAEFRSAVYRNASGQLDFVYQVAHLGAGSDGRNQEITGFTVAEFAGWNINALRDGSDHDGAGVFTAAFNPNPAGFSSLARRGVNGAVLTSDFHATAPFNGLVQGETSTSYIYRTNAFSLQTGTFGVINGSAIGGMTFAAAVPEPATWAMMLGGFGLLGAAARRSRRATTVLA